jgi:hypothetical protein
MVAKGGFTKGPSHKDGGIPMTVKSTGQKIEVEGGEGIINKHSMADNRKYTVSGTPKQIASAINEIDGNGVSFAKGAKITMFDKGGMLYQIDVDDRYLPNRNKYEFYADNGSGSSKIGEVKVSDSYEYPSYVEIKEITLDDEFSHPKSYTYFAQAVADNSKKDGVVMDLLNIKDECFGEMLKSGEVCGNDEYLIIKK